MHNSLDNLGNRVIVDTNVLLDAAFVTDGPSRASIAYLKQLGYTPLVSQGVYEEALGILERLRRKLRLTFNPRRAFERYITNTNFFILPVQPLIMGAGVNKADRHVVAACRHFDAWLLSGDVELILEASNRDKVSGRFPYDVIGEYDLRTTGRPSMRAGFRITSPSRGSGFIFGRAFPGSCQGLKDVGRFTLADLPDFGRVYYDSKNQGWSFECFEGTTVSVQAPILSDTVWMACGNISTNANHKLQAQIRVAGEGFIGSSEPSTLKTGLGSGFNSVRVGSSSDGIDYWNGPIRCIAVGPESIGKDKWKALAVVPEASPNPHETNSLIRILDMLNERHKRSGRAELLISADISIRVV